MATLRTKTVFADRGIVVTAVESLEFRIDGTNCRHFITASLKPIAVIVRESNRSYAFDMNARSIDIDRLDLPDNFELE